MWFFLEAQLDAKYGWDTGYRMRDSGFRQYFSKKPGADILLSIDNHFIDSGYDINW
jgi:hypothetical protein